LQISVALRRRVNRTHGVLGDPKLNLSEARQVKSVIGVAPRAPGCVAKNKRVPYPSTCLHSLALRHLFPSPWSPPQVTGPARAQPLLQPALSHGRAQKLAKRCRKGHCLVAGPNKISLQCIARTEVEAVRQVDEHLLRFSHTSGEQQPTKPPQYAPNRAKRKDRMNLHSFYSPHTLPSWSATRREGSSHSCSANGWGRAGTGRGGGEALFYSA
jgi:hypothetical protein